MTKIEELLMPIVRYVTVEFCKLVEDCSIFDLALEAYNSYMDDYLDGVSYIFNVDKQEDLVTLVNNGVTARHIHDIKEKGYRYCMLFNGGFIDDEDEKKNKLIWMSKKKVIETLVEQSGAIVKYMFFSVSNKSTTNPVSELYRKMVGCNINFNDFLLVPLSLKD
jgi:hypothetical protein